MSGETHRNESGWTVDTLKQHLDSLRESDQVALQAALVAQEKAVAAALTAAKEAVDKANTASEKRFESVNEFRGQLADQTATLIPRQEADQRFDNLSEKLTALTDRVNKTEGSNIGSDITMGKLMSIIGIFLTVVSLVAYIAFNLGHK